MLLLPVPIPLPKPRKLTFRKIRMMVGREVTVERKRLTLPIQPMSLGPCSSPPSPGSKIPLPGLLPASLLPKTRPANVLHQYMSVT
jgi:hypothetical protein